MFNCHGQRCGACDSDLLKDAEWMRRGAHTPSLRIQTAPFIEDAGTPLKLKMSHPEKIGRNPKRKPDRFPTSWE